MDLRQITRLYHTVKHLKLTQVYHQIKYRLVPAKRPIKSTSGTFVLHQLESSPAKAQALEVREGRWQFRFLNLEKTWDFDQIDWSHAEYGMLWTYNLNYFDWLHQENMKPEVGLESLSAFYGVVDQNPIALHPYPTSLRIINASKFVCKWGVQETWLHAQIVADLHLLKNRLEYHLLANHLLENAFALFIGGTVTGERDILDAGRTLLRAQLQEQILEDGMHYERSPMYHMIVLERLLDVLNFAKANDDGLVELLTTYARKMTCLAMNWSGLERIPMMQDSAYGIAFPVATLAEYFRALLEEDKLPHPSKFNSSGYRWLQHGDLKAFANVGAIAPSFQPAHAHSDELNFELYLRNQPIVVDSGISTYEKNVQRLKERSTQSHNCIGAAGHSLSDVWSGFRVGKRAHVQILEDEATILQGSCTNRMMNVIRKFYIANNAFEIHDRVSMNTGGRAFGSLHFHPRLEIQILSAEKFQVSNLEIIVHTDAGAPLIEEFYYCVGFNQRVPAKKIVYPVKSNCLVTIKEV